MEKQPNYVPVFCWKCKAQNNAASTQVCRVCGCYLRSDAETSMKALYVGSITDHPGFKSWIIGGLIFVAFVSGLTYLAIQKKDSAAPTVAAATTKPENKKPDVELPENSWYNQTWWSYVKKHPSPEQIIKKATEVSGKALAPEIAKTFAINGKVSVAAGACLTGRCGIDRLMKKALDMNSFDGGIDYGQKTTIVNQPVAEPKAAPRSPEDFTAFDFLETGIVDVATKIPDKMMRRTTSVMAPGQNGSSVEIREVFNGNAGSKITKFFDDNGKAIRAEKSSKSFDEMVEIRTELGLMWRNNFLKDKEFELKGVEKLNDSTVFVVSSKNKAGERETLYFDTVSGHLTKMDMKGMSIYLDDFRPYEKAIMPYKMYYRKLEKDAYVWLRVDIENWKIGDFVDEAVFEEENLDPALLRKL